jgi:hypothetical protein
MEDTAEHSKKRRQHTVELYTRRTEEQENEDPTGNSHLEDTAENSTHRGHSKEFYCT